MRRLATLFVLLSSASTFAQSTPESMLNKAAQLGREGKSADAVAVLDKLIAQHPKLGTAFYLRGRERFRLGKIDDSVKDFEQTIHLQPELESRLWELGIAYYYANEFEKGARQFELYQTYVDNDVENSVWRFLCSARAGDIETARATMLPIENDRRVPMMEIFGLFKGELKPEEVLSAARSGELDDQQLAGQMFYADLYLGLYYEAHRQDKLAKTHLKRAAEYKINDKEPVNHYMWDVARLHFKGLGETRDK